MPKVTFFESQYSVDIPYGDFLINAIHAAGFLMDSPCGGHGKCKKCSVTVLDGSHAETKLSCQFRVTSDITVKLPVNSGKNKILDSTALSASFLSPILKILPAVIQKPSVENILSDSRLIKNALGNQLEIPLTVAATLHDTLTRRNYTGNFVICQNRLLEILPEEAPCYTLAFDIGTTTIVSYLLNAHTGEEVSVSSMLNPQISYGADVISRSEYAVSHNDGKLTALVRSAVWALTKENAAKAGISPEEIYFAVIVGNTCMQHLFLGISPASLLCAPYTATIDELQLLPASSAGLAIHPAAEIAVLPSIAGFIGGDTIGVLLSLPENTFDRLTLVLDIGTNGEMVLGKGSSLFVCSTAAGPALEGAKISCGMRGATGAIDYVSIQNNRLLFSTIDNAPPRGICGSGLLDLICCLLELGILSSNGRFNKPENWPPETAANFKHRMVKRGGISAFLLEDDENSVYLTQKDIREVQLAKSAISSGLQLLCRHLNVKPEEIESVLLAGAFGSYMSPKSACRIGLLPACLEDKITSIQNAAGAGAKLVALSKDMLVKSTHIAETVQFVELAASKDFQNTFIRNLDF